MLAVLAKCGGSPRNVAKVTAYVVGLSNWKRFDRAFAAAFGQIRPARVVVPVPELHYGYAVEVEALAVGLDVPHASVCRPLAEISAKDV
jgi:enamine deaminase RidA (YjgF/YER057c/UK114 family)